MTLPNSNSWLKNAIIYQLFTGRWQSASLITHQGRVFNQLAKLDYSNLVESGINTIYLLGIFDNTGPIIVDTEQNQSIHNHPNRLPSPFAISNHTTTNPNLGSVSDLKNLIALLQQKDFKIILDFVPNHTSTAHPWIKNHPEYYLYTNNKPIAEFSGDVYKLNYHNQWLQEEMIAILETIASWQADGVRVDMAHLVPLHFWRQTIRRIKTKHPNFVFLAEAYSTVSPIDMAFITPLLESGFDAIYHGPLYSNLQKILPTDNLIKFLKDHLDFVLVQPDNNRLINYFANHDDVFIQSQDFLEALLGLILFLPGIPFIYNGSLNGISSRLAHHYYDELNNNFLEINHLPDNFQKLFTFKLQHQSLITSVKLEPTGLLTCQMKTNSKPATLTLNFTSKPQLINQDHAKLNSGQALITP